MHLEWTMPPCKNLNLLKLACNCDKKQAIVYPLLLKRWMEYSCKDDVLYFERNLRNPSESWVIWYDGDDCIVKIN